MDEKERQKQQNATDMTAIRLLKKNRKQPIELRGQRYEWVGSDIVGIMVSEKDKCHEEFKVSLTPHIQRLFPYGDDKEAVVAYDHILSRKCKDGEEVWYRSHGVTVSEQTPSGEWELSIILARGVGRSSDNWVQTLYHEALHFHHCKGRLSHDERRCFDDQALGSWGCARYGLEKQGYDSRRWGEEAVAHVIGEAAILRSIALQGRDPRGLPYETECGGRGCATGSVGADGAGRHIPAWSYTLLTTLREAQCPYHILPNLIAIAHGITSGEVGRRTGDPLYIETLVEKYHQDFSSSLISSFHPISSLASSPSFPFEADAAVRSLHEHAICREVKARGYHDGESRWEALPEPLRTAIDALNRFPPEERKLALADLRQLLEVVPESLTDLKQALSQAQAQVRTQGRGRRL